MKKMIIRDYFTGKVVKTRKLNEACRFTSLAYQYENGYIVIRDYFEPRKVLMKIKSPTSVRYEVVDVED